MGFCSDLGRHGSVDAGSVEYPSGVCPGACFRDPAWPWLGARSHVADPCPQPDLLILHRILSNDTTTCAAILVFFRLADPH